MKTNSGAKLLYYVLGTDALEDTVLTWNINALNTNASMIVTDRDYESTGLIQR